MSVYRIELTAQGALTQMPDSQKIFGALVYLLSETYGGEEATELTKAVLHKKSHLALSNLMPLGYLPVPQDYVMDMLVSPGKTEKQEGEEKEEEGLKKKRKAVKARSYLREAELKRLWKAPQECGTIFPYVEIQNQQLLRASIESVRYGIPELESKLYSVPTVALQAVFRGEKDKEKRPIKDFCFYLQAGEDSNADKLVSLLKRSAQEKRMIILGKRASQNLNTFVFKEAAEEKLPDAPGDKFLNMGMLLPDKINFVDSRLNLFTSERRPFQMDGGWNKNFKKQYISFIAEGSIIALAADMDTAKAGKSIPSPFESQRDIVFGNAFLYPLPQDEGRV